MRVNAWVVVAAAALVTPRAQAQVCDFPYGLGTAEVTIAAGGVLTPGPTSCPSPTGYDKHRLTLPAQALYFDTTFEMRPPTSGLLAEVFGSPPPPYPSRLVAVVPGSARRLRKAADLEVEFHLSDKPAGVPAEEMRAYRWLPGPTRHWEQLRGFDDAVTIPSGAFLAKGPADAFDSRSFYAAQVGAVLISSPVTGALLGSNSVTVTGKVRFFDISQGSTQPCAGFALTVNGQAVTPSCATGDFTTTIGFGADGTHAIEARLVGPSGDISLDEVVVETDDSPPDLLETDPEHEDTFTAGWREIKAWFTEAHTPVNATIAIGTESPQTMVPCPGEPDCVSYNYDWPPNPTGEPVAITLTDSLGNSMVYNRTLYPMTSATVYGLVLDALMEPPPADADLIAGMSIQVAEAPAITATSYTPSITVDSTRVNYALIGDPDTLNGRHLFKFKANDPGAPRTMNNCACPSPGCPYAAFGLVAGVRLKKGYYILNQAPREPVRLPPIDDCAGVDVPGDLPLDPYPDCTTQAAVDVSDPGSGTVLHIPLGTKLTFANAPPGGCGSGTISVTEVPRDKTPQSLPPDMVPSIIVTIQPSELQFDPPPPITFPNRVYNPGTGPAKRMTLFSVDPRTDVFLERGPMEIVGSAGSGTIVSLAGTGVGIAGWHCPHGPGLGGMGGGPGGG